MADLPAFRLASQAHLKPAHPCVPSSISLVGLRMQAEELEAVALGFEDGESSLADQSQREAAREEVKVLSELGRASLEPVVKLYQRLVKPPRQWDRQDRTAFWLQHASQLDEGLSWIRQVLHRLETQSQIDTGSTEWQDFAIADESVDVPTNTPAAFGELGKRVFDAHKADTRQPLKGVPCAVAVPAAHIKHDRIGRGAPLDSITYNGQTPPLRKGVESLTGVIIMVVSE